MRKKVLLFFTFLFLTYLALCKSAILPAEASEFPAGNENIVMAENTHYYLDQNNKVYLAKVYSKDGKLNQILEFFEGTTLETAGENIYYIFEIDDAGYVTKATKFDQTSRLATNYYEYYPNTEYGEHKESIKYEFFTGPSGYLSKAIKRNQLSQKAVTYYEYYPKTTYGGHGKKIKYVFDIDSSGNIKKASKRELGTNQISTRYEYYPKTVYGEHGKNIKYVFDINSSGSIKKVSMRERGTKRIIKRYEYYPKTKYGTHGNNIKFIFDIDSSGFIKKASMREQGTKRITKRYEYYPKTKYGAHGNKIKFIFDLDISGYLKKAIKREQGSKKILVRYNYMPKTVYGNHSKRIIEKKINVPLISQLPELPTGCEITAVTMMLQYNGNNVNKITLAKEMPRHSWDPNKGYVGNPFTKRGWTIYPSALNGTIKKYTGSAKNLTGTTINNLEKYLASNKPVVVWVSPMHRFRVHALVLTGYNTKNFYYNDPWTGQKDVKISKANFKKMWKNQNNRAITY